MIIIRLRLDTRSENASVISTVPKYFSITSVVRRSRLKITNNEFNNGLTSVPVSNVVSGENTWYGLKAI